MVDSVLLAGQFDCFGLTDGRITMLITTGQVQNGAIEVDHNSLLEGAKFTILVHEDDETFKLSADEEANLLAAVAEAERGDA
ncbi:MAG TPA: hypothetical protein VGO73_01395 [Pyrinomonadaceae bacterium]|jgi:hypothetical protein|nr:hypothetical protein [Pyrinomonadaceae bacterium]